MIRFKLARIYAEALLDVAKERGALEDVARDAENIRDLLASNREIAELFDLPDVSPAEMKNALEKAFSGGVHRFFLNMLLVLADNRRLSFLGPVCEAVGDYYNDLTGLVEARVITAEELDEGRRGRLAETIGRKTGKKVSLENRVDPNIIGGVVIVMDDTKIDGSVSTRLEKIKQGVIERLTHGV